MSERFAIVPRKVSSEEEGEKASRGRKRTPGGWREEDLLDEVDRILEKISARGMGALTDGERRVLDEVSRKRRSN